MSTIEAKLDALMSKINNQERENHLAHEVGVVVDVEKKNEEGLAHEGPYNMEEAEYIHGNRAITLNSTTTS